MDKLKHESLKSRALKRPAVKKAYDDLEQEFQLLKELIQARLEAGMTQQQVAEAMNTTTSVIGRLETGGGRHKHSPTLETLRKYAGAVNCDLEIKLVHKGHEKYKHGLYLQERGETYKKSKK